MDYRKLYEKLCHIKIPKGYVIHHIDYNRGNNAICNLVMLPYKLHVKYHRDLEEYRESIKMFDLREQLSGFTSIGYGYNDFAITETYKKAEKFVRTWYKCSKYVNYRDYCLGLLPFLPEIQLVEEELLYGKN